MFDVNPDAAKFYLKEIERQVAAARLVREAGRKGMESTGRELRSGRYVAQCSRLSAQAVASALRGAVAGIF